jgi:hypothetical protein
MLNSLECAEAGFDRGEPTKPAADRKSSFGDQLPLGRSPPFEARSQQAPAQHSPRRLCPYSDQEVNLDPFRKEIGLRQNYRA